MFVADLSMAIGHYVKFTDTFIEFPDSRLSAMFDNSEEFVFSIVQQLVSLLANVFNKSGVVYYDLYKITCSRPDAISLGINPDSSFNICML